MAFSITLSQPSQNTFGAIGTLATVAVELVLPRLMLRTHAIITAPLCNVDPLMLTHNFGNLVVHQEVSRLASHHHHILRLMDFQIAIITKEG